MEADQIASNAGSLLEALRMGVEYTFTIRLRGLAVPMRPLSITERVRVINDVAHELSMKRAEEQTNITQSSLLAIRMLEMGSTDANAKSPKLTAHVLSQMTNDEVIALYNAYIEGCEKLDPALETISEEELLKLIDHAKKNDSALTGFSRPQLESVARHFLRTAEQPQAK